jgi:hypothetical protein
MKKLLPLGIVATATLATSILAVAAPADASTYVGHYTTGHECAKAGAYYVRVDGAAGYTCPASPLGGNDLYLY